jgi:protein-S-isoprenylcysteine O-methyltransferase
MIPAFIIAIGSVIIRCLAFYTAKSNFTHQVAYKKKKRHELVTDGIYSILRHPSYTGFYYFSIFSMILIGNFICAILFGCMLSCFF